MRPYFETMPSFGRELKENRITRTQESRAKLEAVEAEIAALRKARQEVGIPAAEINKRGSMTVWQRIDYLVDKDSFLPLHSLYNPEGNEEGTTNVVDGLGKIGGRWAVIIGFDNKLLAGAWIPGQPENILRVTNIAKRLHIPLVWLVQCSGVKMTDQEQFYADRRGSGTCFYRHAELEQMGIPILAGIYGTNPAGGGYQSISPTILLAHKDANMAVGGVGIVSGMSPKGGFDVAGLEELVAKTSGMRGQAAGSGRNPLRRDRFLYPGVRRRKPSSRRHQRIHAGDPRLRPDVFPGRRAEGTEAHDQRPLPFGAGQSERGLYLRRNPRPLGRRQRTHGVPPRLRA